MTIPDTWTLVGIEAGVNWYANERGELIRVECLERRRGSNYQELLRRVAWLAEGELVDKSAFVR